jgi:hypothetical protein
LDDGRECLIGGGVKEGSEMRRRDVRVRVDVVVRDDAEEEVRGRDGGPPGVVGEDAALLRRRGVRVLDDRDPQYCGRRRRRRRWRRYGLEL